MWCGTPAEAKRWALRPEHTEQLSASTQLRIRFSEQPSGNAVTYDPRRLTGVSVYREVAHEFSVGDKIQFTAPDKTLSVANRDLAVIESVRPDGQIPRASTPAVKSDSMPWLIDTSIMDTQSPATAPRVSPPNAS